MSETSTRCSPGAGADEQDSDTGGTGVIVPAAGLGKDGALDAVAATDGLEVGEGEWATRAVEVLPHAARVRMAAIESPAWRIIKRPRILPGGTVDG